LLSFAKLGSYGPDNESCFGISGSRNTHKYKLAQIANSFVLFAKSSDSEGVGRCFGQYKNGVICFTNKYIKYISGATFDLLLKEVGQHLLKNTSLIQKEKDLTSRSIYLNGDSTIFGTEEKAINSYRFTMPKNSISIRK
jgi:hypothetical protein